MASRIVVMKLGRVQQVGSPIEIYNKPANLFVATFIGSPAMNVMKATYDNGKIVLLGGHEIPLSEEIVAIHDAHYKAEVEKGEAELEALRQKQAGLKAPDAAIEKEIADLSERVQKDRAALAGSHDIIFGIRPEDIIEGKGDGKVEEYKIRVAVAELLGHEYYVHTDFGGIDLIAKIPLTHEIKLGDEMGISFRVEKAHIFDAWTEARIY